MDRRHEKNRSNREDTNIRRLKEIWIISSVLIFLSYLCMVALDVVFSDGTARTLYLSAAGGVPLLLVTVIALVFAKKLKRIPLIMAVFNQLAFLTIGVFTQRLNSYFFILLIMIGIFSITKLWRQMVGFVTAGVVINIAFMLFAVPFLERIDGYIFFLQFLMTLFGSSVLLIQTYNIAKRDKIADRAFIAFSSLLYSTPNYTVITDSKNKVLHISKPLARFAHFSSQEIAVGKPLLDLFADKEMKLMFADILNAEGFVEKIIHIDINGERRNLKIIADKLSGDNEGLFIDITDITQLVTSQEEALSANLAKSRFLAAMSHEIRTPMNAIIGTSQIQLQARDIPDKYADAFEKIYDSGNSLLGIINDILDMSKIEIGKLKLVETNYDLPSLINDAIQMNVINIGSKSIELLLDIDANLPSRMIGDELRLKQVLNNLLSNAIKYTEKGHVRLSMSHTVEDGAVFLCFAVEDTGQGMKAEDKEKLFTEYTRFNSESNQYVEGTGLGLNITRNLVELMGGEITVESEFGKGSSFVVKVKQLAVECPPIGKEVVGKLSTFTFTKCRKDMRNTVREVMPYGKVLIVDDVDT
ncbi:MAG: ATP-binding protein, partial [Oscillospiraceae bacterium]|nr:ATP-binding protein [Oscillospiraceae bacterium]